MIASVSALRPWLPNTGSCASSTLTVATSALPASPGSRPGNALCRSAEGPVREELLIEGGSSTGLSCKMRARPAKTYPVAPVDLGHRLLLYIDRLAYKRCPGRRHSRRRARAP